MMKFLNAVVLLCLTMAVSGFVAPSPAAFSARTATLAKATYSQKVGRAPASRTTVSNLRMAAKGVAAPTKSFWEGEWVCADCGYIYDVDDCGGLYLEEQPRGFVCPQCRGPRRRFAKKVGDQVGITQDGGDAPILLFSFLGLGLTVAFGFWFASQ